MLTKRVPVLIALALVAPTSSCGGGSPKPAHPAPRASASSVAAREAPVPAATPFERLPTLAASGAETCRTSKHELGPAYFLSGFPTPVVTGFGPRGGLATWLAPGSTALRFRALSPTAEPRAGTHDVSVPKNFKPRRVVALDRGFLVLGELYAWMDMRWAAIATDAEGRPQGELTELDLHHRYLQDVSPADGRRVVVLAMRALMVPEAEEGLRGRWLEITVGPDGKLTQAPRDLQLAYPLVRALDRVYPFELEGKPAWYISRANGREDELVAGGELERLTPEQAEQRGLQVVNKDRVELVIELDSEGIRVHRVAGGERVGKPTELPPGNVGLLDSHVWSGRAWVFSSAPQTESASTAQLLVLDCK